MTEMDKRDCIFPDCLVPTDFGHACEHSCPWEKEMRSEREPTDADRERDFDRAEAADIRYRADMKDAGRGRLLR